MNLETWQKQNNISDKELAAKVGIHVSFLSHIRAGRKSPSLNTALKIESATGGNVTVRELSSQNKGEASR
jgi:transcriptional regulator with XRE-family HTH domain